MVSVNNNSIYIFCLSGLIGNQGIEVLAQVNKSEDKNLKIDEKLKSGEKGKLLGTI